MIVESSSVVLPVILWPFSEYTISPEIKQSVEKKTTFMKNKRTTHEFGV